MSIQVSEFINIRQKLEDLGGRYPAAGFALLPLNISSASSLSELRQASDAATIRKLLLQEGLPLVDIFAKDQRPPYVKNKASDWISSVIFVSATLWQQNRELVSVALNLISNYVYDTLKGAIGSRTAKMDVVIEGMPEWNQCASAIPGRSKAYGK